MSCCGSNKNGCGGNQVSNGNASKPPATTPANNEDFLRNIVREHYKAVVDSAVGDAKNEKQQGCCSSTGSCFNLNTSEEYAIKLGYSKEDLDGNFGANIGQGCGNPLAIAQLKQGEVVLDLGSGAGFDAFLARRAVGALIF
jgi:arsenite methyltransferase